MENRGINEEFLELPMENVMIYRALQLPPEAWLRLGLIHSSLTMVCILPSGKVFLDFFGDSGHLPEDKATTF